MNKKNCTLETFGKGVNHSTNLVTMCSYHETRRQSIWFALCSLLQPPGKHIGNKKDWTLDQQEHLHIEGKEVGEHGPVGTHREGIKEERDILEN